MVFTVVINVAIWDDLDQIFQVLTTKKTLNTTKITISQKYHF